MNATNETHAKVAEYIGSLGLTYSARFVPQSLSRNAGEKQPTLNWQVTLTRRGHTFRTDYQQGIGHIPGWQYSRRADYAAYERDVAETGRYKKNWEGFGTGMPLPAPDVADVLYYLVSDATAFGQFFEEWASELGYDTDSRKAEAMYRVCLDTAEHLRRLFTSDELTTLTDLFRDY